MSSSSSPHQIITTLFPHLKIAAGYANQIQSKIKALPAKGLGNNFFSAALTDADISIQTLIEVALLSTFPEIRFYGEEYEQSRNTKYFRATDLGLPGDYLITLDPIDGTKFYLDGHNNYQIILGILNADDFEAVIAISPGQNMYYYALRGNGTYQGDLSKNLSDSIPLKINKPKRAILLGWGMGFLKSILKEKYQVVDLENDYSTEVIIPNLNGILASEITGAIIRRGKFIDGGALAFLAKEAGCIVTTLDGSSLPPLHTCKDYSLPGLLIATSQSVHQDLLEAFSKTN